MNQLVTEVSHSVRICQSDYQTTRELFLLAHPVYGIYDGVSM